MNIKECLREILKDFFDEYVSCVEQEETYDTLDKYEDKILHELAQKIRAEKKKMLFNSSVEERERIVWNQAIEHIANMIEDKV